MAGTIAIVAFAQQLGIKLAYVVGTLHLAASEEKFVAHCREVGVFLNRDRNCLIEGYFLCE